MDNWQEDYLSWQFLDPVECSPHPEVFQILCHRWETLDVDVILTLCPPQYFSIRFPLIVLMYFELCLPHSHYSIRLTLPLPFLMVSINGNQLLVSLFLGNSDRSLFKLMVLRIVYHPLLSRPALSYS